MNTILEAIDNIYFANQDSEYNVINALYLEYDKIEQILLETDNPVIQESFTKPSRNESTLTKVVLAVPRFIYKIINAIITKIKSIFKPKRQAPIITPEEQGKMINNIIEFIKEDPGMSVLVSGAVVGTAAYFKSKVKSLKDDIDLSIDIKKQYKQMSREIRDETNFKKIEVLDKEYIKAHQLLQFEVPKKDSKEKYIKILSPIQISKSIDDMKKFINHTKQGIIYSTNATANVKNKKDYFNKLDAILKDLNNNTFVANQVLMSLDKFEYTQEEWNKEIQSINTKELSEYMKSEFSAIGTHIGKTLKGFYESEEEADKKEDKLINEGNKYAEKIITAMEKHILLFVNVIDVLNNMVQESFIELSKFKDGIPNDKSSENKSGNSDSDENKNDTSNKKPQKNPSITPLTTEDLYIKVEAMRKNTGNPFRDYDSKTGHLSFAINDKEHAKWITDDTGIVLPNVTENERQRFKPSMFNPNVFYVEEINGKKISSLDDCMIIPAIRGGNNDSEVIKKGKVYKKK